MTFVLRMAWREFRSSWTRLLFFFLCVAIGVAAIVALRSVIQEVRETLTREARDLVGADLVVLSGRPWPEEVTPRLAAYLAEPRVLERMEVVETATMASTEGRAQLIELRAIEAGFPYYGTLELQSGRPWSASLLQGRGLVVQPELLVQMGVAVGDTITLDRQPFTIRDVVVRDRVQGRNGFAFGPRVYIDLAELRQTSILTFGSRASYQWYARVQGDEVDGLTDDLRRDFRRSLVSVRSWRTVEDRLGRNLTLAENYLSLVGFSMVVLGGIGVWSVTRVFIQQKIRSVAVLKCVGASSNTVLATYVVQVMGLAGAGSLVGVAIAAAGIAAIPASVVTLAGVESVGVTWSAALQGMAVGMLVSLLFALVPLLEIRDVKPLMLLRADSAPNARRRGWRSMSATVLIGAALVAVAVWQAGSIAAGLYVSVGLLAVAGVLAGAAWALIRVVAPLTRSRRFALRHAVVSLGRPGNQTRVILTAVGLGCFLILGVRALQSNLQEEFNLAVGDNAPDLVLFDIQRDQVDGVRALVRPFLKIAPGSSVAADPPLLPLLRGRVVGVDGARTKLATAEDVRREGELAREYGITYRMDLADNERLVAGDWWQGPSTDTTGPLEVSIEQRLVDEHAIGIGDRLRIDIAGRVVEARVTNVRKVSWDETQNGGFIFVFRPGPVIERAPHTFVGFLQVNPGADVRGTLQRDVVRAFPNVSVIDVGTVLASVREVVDNATVAITVVGAVTVVSGILVLVGAVAMAKFQRVYDAAIYRTLGASSRRLAAMVIIEYGVLGALAGALGAAGALALSWGVATHLFEIEWRPDWWTLGGGVGATALVVAGVGLLASIDIIIRKPLGVLRQG
ncbi:MAG TPA: ABC transporter permease [Vicinamibacterales bacterium]|nr:ABC transporter permease [Vicinamibacterales bacterium]